METKSAKGPHVGRNIQTFRLIKGKSQLQLAADLEEKIKRSVSQQFISDLEAKESIDDDELLAFIAQILEVHPDALKHLDLEDHFNVIGNSFYNNATQQINYKNTVNNQHSPDLLDRIMAFINKEKEELKQENENLKTQIAKLKKGKRN